MAEDSFVLTIIFFFGTPFQTLYSHDATLFVIAYNFIICFIMFYTIGMFFTEL